MSEPKKQHHVPRAYLKNFAEGHNKTYRFYVIDKKSKKVFQNNIENVAAERNFYTLEQCEDKYAWEKYYAQVIEPEMEHTLKEVIHRASNCLIQSGAEILNDNLKEKMAVFMVVQFLRSRNTRDYAAELLKDMHPKLLKQTQEHFNQLGRTDLAEKVKNYSIGEDLFKMSLMEISLDLGNIQRYSEVLFEKIWVIYRITGENEFITSDHPIMNIDLKSFNVTPFRNGIKEDTTAISYPISPKLLLVLYSKNLLFGEISKYHNRVIFLNADKEQKFIDKYNKKQYEQCNRQAFGKSKISLEKI